MRARAAAALLGSALALAPPAFAQGFRLADDAKLRERANGALTLVGFTVVPDVTTGSLSINDSAAANPDLSMISFGGGFTWSKETPLFLEGTAAANRYNPSFVFSQGQDTGRVPLKWNSVIATGGIGWDFPIAEDLVWRPILNVSLGHMESDLSIAGRVLEDRTSRELEFLKRGRMNLFGLGGSIMLDYERVRPDHEVDVELRYTDIRLRSFDSSEAVQGESDARSLGLWSRYRAPTGMRALDRPVRYVLEYAFTRFYGNLDGALGFRHLNSFGVGLELDSSKFDIFVKRTRLVFRYVVGDHVNGGSLGLAMSF